MVVAQMITVLMAITAQITGAARLAWVDSQVSLSSMNQKNES